MKILLELFCKLNSEVHRDWTDSLSLPQCVDLSCNELTEVTLPETLPPKLQELDLTGNPRRNLDHKSLELLKYEPQRSCSSDNYREICLTCERTGWPFVFFFPFLCSNIKCFRVDPSPSAPCVNERHGAPAVWSHGYTEASGVKNKWVLPLSLFYSCTYWIYLLWDQFVYLSKSVRTYLSKWVQWPFSRWGRFVGYYLGLFE